MMDRPDENLPTQVRSSFESLKRLNVHAAEYWSARDLMPKLGYRQWRRFEDAIRRAATSCQQSGNDPSNHFAGAGKMVPWVQEACYVPEGHANLAHRFNVGLAVFSVG